jgi:uncharacterized protein YkwD
MRHFVAFVLLGLLSLPISTAAAAPANANSYVARVLELTNDERANAGLPPLELSPALEDSAQTYSDVLASSGCFAHTCGPTPDFVDRDAAAGYTDWSSIGENIAAGYPTPEAVVAGWMASPGHRANILSPNYTEIGIGVAEGGATYGSFWTEEFGSR